MTWLLNLLWNLCSLFIKDLCWIFQWKYSMMQSKVLMRQVYRPFFAGHVRLRVRQALVAFYGMFVNAYSGDRLSLFNCVQPWLLACVTETYHFVTEDVRGLATALSKITDRGELLEFFFMGYVHFVIIFLQGNGCAVIGGCLSPID